MARKNLLQGLIEEASKSQEAPEASPSPTPSTAPEETRVDAARPRYAGGAIGAVSQSIADLKSRAVIEVDAAEISDGGLPDRLEQDQGDHTALVASIRDYGQQVPVLLRPNPNNPERYQVVYGRRRVKALRELGLPVKALVRELDDRDLIIAQGQENSARKDLSFIEKANFARAMEGLGYERKIICAALHVDKTVISRMLSVADAIAPELIQAIGAAPSVGRDRWLKLAQAFEASGWTVQQAVTRLRADAGDQASDSRFEALLSALVENNAAPQPDKLAAETIRLEDQAGQILASVAQRADKTIFTLPAKSSDGFDRWLMDNLSEIHRNWKQGSGE